MRRYRGKLAAAAAVLATAVTGAVVAVIYALAAEENAARANANESLANQRAEDNARLAVAERAAREKAEAEGQRASRLGEGLTTKIREYDQLACVVLIDRALAAEQLLYPPWPGQIEPMRRWLEEQAAPLLAMRRPMWDTIRRLRTVAVPQSDAERATDIRSHPRFTEWEELRDRVAGLREAAEASTDGAMARQREAVEEQFATLTKIVEERRTYRFMDLPDSEFTSPEAISFLHDTLSGLICKIEDLEARTKRDVELRLSWAEQIAQLTLAHPNAPHEWAAVRAAIAANPNYEGQAIDLRDEDVMGLVPIGENPATKLWEFYELRSAWDGEQDPRTIAIPEHRADGSIDVKAETGIVFVLLPGGTFWMGAQRKNQDAPNYDLEAQPHEFPVHEVTLRPFLLGRHELTRGQWERMTATRPFWFKEGEKYEADGIPIGGTHPAESMDWHMANQCMERHGLLLPTEAQWEYGCRARTTTPWSAGAVERDLQGVANVHDQTSAKYQSNRGSPAPFSDAYTANAPVGCFRPNPFGLYDMHGNVREWCRDLYGSYRGKVQPGDGYRAHGPSLANYVCRDGSSSDSASYSRSAKRTSFSPSTKSATLGVRPSRSIHH